MSLNQIPRDKNGKPLKLHQMVVVDLKNSKFLGPPEKLGRVMNVGHKKSTIELEGGKIDQFDNSKIEVRFG